MKAAVEGGGGGDVFSLAADTAVPHYGLACLITACRRARACLAGCRCCSGIPSWSQLIWLPIRWWLGFLRWLTSTCPWCSCTAVLDVWCELDMWLLWAVWVADLCKYAVCLLHCRLNGCTAVCVRSSRLLFPDTSVRCILYASMLTHVPKCVRARHRACMWVRTLYRHTRVCVCTSIIYAQWHTV